MPKINNHRIIDKNTVVEDNWQTIAKDFTGDLPTGDLLLPLKFWLENQAAAEQHQGNIGLWIDSDEEIEEIGENANKFAVIAVNFPVFADGRGFSTGRLLRERYQFQGQLRAIGQVIRDQLYYLKRCGFDAYQLRDGYDLEESLDSLNGFSVQYQSAVDQPLPLFRRR